MSEPNETPEKGWSFQRSSSEDTPDKDGSRDEPLVRLTVPDALSNNVSTILLMSLTVVLFMGFLVLGPGASSGLQYNVPGGAVESLSASDVKSWIRVTNDLRVQISSGAGPAVRSSTLFSYFGELDHHEDLRKRVRALCKKRDISFDTYRKWTQDIAHTYPFEEMDELDFELEAPEPIAENESSRRSTLQANRQVVYDHLESLKTCWTKLQSASESKRTAGPNRSGQSAPSK